MVDVIPPESEDPIVRKTREYVLLGKQAAVIKTRRDGIKAALLAEVEMRGEPDDKGHDFLELPEDVEGVYGLQRQHRISRTFNEERAEALLTEKDLVNRVYKTVVVLDQDEIMACLAEGVLTEDEVDSLFDKDVTYAFLPVKH